MLNQVTIQGNLTRDCEVKTLNNGTKITIFCVAVQRNFKDAAGQYQTDFIDCMSFEKTDFISKYFHKGDSIIVTGELQTRTYDDKNGVKHKVTTINVSKAFFAGGKKNDNRTSGSATTASVAPAESESESFEADDSGELPFE